VIFTHAAKPILLSMYAVLLREYDVRTFAIYHPHIFLALSKFFNDELQLAGEGEGIVEP